MEYSEMKKYVASLSDCHLSRKDMIESHESIVLRCRGELESAHEDSQNAIFSRASRKEKKEKFDYESCCIVELFEALDKLTAVKLFYRLEEKNNESR